MKHHGNSEQFPPAVIPQDSSHFIDTIGGFAMFAEDDFVPRCVKTGVFFINCAYWILGVVVMGIGLHVHIYQMQPIQELITIFISPACLMMFLGAILFITAIFGCVGAMRENICLIRWYLVLLLFLLTVHVAMGAVAFIVLFTSHSVHDNAEEILRNALFAYKEVENSADYINYLQTTLECCGIGPDGYKDWNMNPYFSCNSFNPSSEKCSVPSSCCKVNPFELSNLMCGFGAMNDSLMTQHQLSMVVNVEGCIPKLEENIRNAALVLGLAAFVAAIPLLCGILLSTCMIQSIDEKLKDFWKNQEEHNKVIHFIPSNNIFHVTDSAVTNLKQTATHDSSGICKTM